MIVIGIGANLPHPVYGPPRRTCGAAMEMMENNGLRIERRSRWYQTEPVLSAPDGAQGPQPWYVNGAALLDTDLDASSLLARLLEIETKFGRVRSIANAPRTLDLDIIACHDQVLNEEGLNVPHPRLHERAFVLFPLRDLLPAWRHPTLGQDIDTLIANLPEDQSFREMSDADGVFGTEWHEKSE